MNWILIHAAIRGYLLDGVFAQYGPYSPAYWRSDGLFQPVDSCSAPKELMACLWMARGQAARRGSDGWATLTEADHHNLFLGLQTSFQHTHCAA